MIAPRLKCALESVLAARIERTSRISGGDINEAFELALADGRRLFLKTNASADPAMFPAEARGLDWLRAARCLRIPEVVAVSSGRAGEPAFLVLELLDSARPGAGFDEALGRGLAALHGTGAPSFGLDHDNFIGRLPQSNRARATWAEFYGEERLIAQLSMAVSAGRAPAELRRGIEALVLRLPNLVGETELAARLHGDLWGGNLHVDVTGAPSLIDPAVYGGHREMDLAMMRLFGGFGPRVFDAYAESHPLAKGHEKRVRLYQIYPLLVHLNLFGASYLGQVLRAIEPYL